MSCIGTDPATSKTLRNVSLAPIADKQWSSLHDAKVPEGSTMPPLTTRSNAHTAPKAVVAKMLQAVAIDAKSNRRSDKNKRDKHRGAANERKHSAAQNRQDEQQKKQGSNCLPVQRRLR